MGKMRLFIVFAAIAVFSISCKEDATIDNPYDDQVPENADGEVTIDDKEINPISIQGLHKNIFKPTCANSGCHDGLFEPDFRTVESSFNSLVNQEPIKNDEVDPLPARVVPGDHARSMLIRRLEEDLNNNSGIMPLALEPGSDWEQKKAEYIQNIKDWIDAGALDSDSNSREVLDYPPQLEGMIVVKNGNIISRGGRYNPINVPKSHGSVDVWFAYKDAESAFSEFTNMRWNNSIHFMDYDSLAWRTMTYEATPMTAVGINQEDADHHFKFTLNLSTYEAGDVIWLRTRVEDAENQIELPNDNSQYNTLKYCTIRLY